jgi:hypothetical protein
MPKPVKFRANVAIVAGAALTLMMTGLAAPATADPSATESCSFTETLCLFDGEDFTGERFTVSSLDPAGTCVSLVDHGWDGRVRSAFNTHASSAALFLNDDCVGGPYQVPGNSGISSLGGFTPASVWVAG